MRETMSLILSSRSFRSSAEFLPAVFHARKAPFSLTYSFHILLPASLLAVSASYNELVRRILAFSGLLAQSRLAPGRNRTRTTNGGLALTTTMRVVVRVHDRAADVRPNAFMPGFAGLAQADVAVAVSYTHLDVYKRQGHR